MNSRHLGVTLLWAGFSGLLFDALPLHAENQPITHRADDSDSTRSVDHSPRKLHPAPPTEAPHPLDSPELERLVERAIETGNPKPVIEEIQRVIQEKKFSKQIIQERLDWFPIVEALAAETMKAQEAGAVDSAGMKSLAYTARVLRAMKTALQAAYPQKSPAVTLEEASNRVITSADFQELELHIAELKMSGLNDKTKTQWKEVITTLHNLKILHEKPSTIKDINRLVYTNYSAGDLIAKLDLIIGEIRVKTK